MLLPYSTDAPLYHRPLVTGGLIALNTLIFAITYSAELNDDIEAVRPWLLYLGQGLHPVQWLTANFLHAGFSHLLGNMLGLWVFGLIVEGKIGWWRFLALYLGLGIVALAIFQLLALGVDSNYLLGASGIIYALMGIALIWAPENDVHFFLLLLFYPFTFAMTVWATAVGYIGLEFLLAVLSGQVISSAGIHLIGAILGIAIGVGMVRRQWVDCEHWDLFSVWAGHNQLSREERAALDRKTHAPAPEERAQQGAMRLEQIREILAQDQPRLAWVAHRKMANTNPEWRLPEELLRRLVAGCLKQGMTTEAMVLMREYLGQYTEYATLMRLKLAEVLLRHEQRPAQAQRVLAKIPTAGLPPKQHQYRQQLATQAQAMIEQGSLEPEAEDW